METESTALVVPPTRKISDPLELARGQAGRLPAFDDRLDDFRGEESQRQCATDRKRCCEALVA